MIFYKRYTLFFLLFCLFVFPTLAEKTPSFIGLNAPKTIYSPPGASILRHSSKLGALNVKLMPALYWSSLGAEVEYPVSDAFSVGVNLIGKLGRTDGNRVVFKIRPETTQDPAFRVELVGKYYFKKTAPIGIYAQVNVSYGNLFFFDGTNRPYTLHSKWKKFNDGVRSPADFETPRDYSFGIGGGYQLIVIPKKIIANIMVGSQLYLEESSGMYPAIYVSPSIGYLF